MTDPKSDKELKTCSVVALVLLALLITLFSLEVATAHGDQATIEGVHYVRLCDDAGSDTIRIGCPWYRVGPRVTITESRTVQEATP